MTDQIDIEVANQLKMLRKQCTWQRSQGTERDNGYPYHKHFPDCDICRSADLIERLARDRDKALQTTIDISDEHTELQTRIEELENHCREWAFKAETNQTKQDAALAALNRISGDEWGDESTMMEFARTEAKRIRGMK